eukprot:9272884-Pyramimonas_sp.AAC.1
MPPGSATIIVDVISSGLGAAASLVHLCSVPGDCLHIFCTHMMKPFFAVCLRPSSCFSCEQYGGVDDVLALLGDGAKGVVAVNAATGGLGPVFAVLDKRVDRDDLCTHSSPPFRLGVT